MCADDGICQETLLWSVVALCAAKKKLLRRKKRRALWCKQWLSRRHLKGSFNQIFMELQVENPTDFENYTRMPIPAFYKLLTKIEPYICKQDTSFRDSISPGARLEATLRFLAAGGSYTSLQYSTRISKQSLGLIIPETCEPIYNVLREDYLKVRFKYRYKVSIYFSYYSNNMHIRSIYLHVTINNIKKVEKKISTWK